MVLPDASDKDVGKAIVVVVADGHAHAIEFDVQTGVGSHVGECAVAVVVIEAQRGARFLVARPIGAVDEQDILPAVAVIVEERATGAESFGQEFSAEGSAVVLELDARMAGHIGEAKAGRGGSRTLRYAFSRKERARYAGPRR